MLAVRDTGIGIPAEKQKLIFDAFQQADGTTSRKYGGTGLGLTISREIAHLLGGTIEVESAPNQGSTFTLCVPASYPGANQVATRESSRSSPLEGSERLPPAIEADLAEIRILVVDDDTRNLYALKSMLEARRIEVMQAENGKVALDILQAHPDVDLVLMDTMMPELDGLEATRAIRDMLQFQKLPIISLTAKAMQGDREAALLAGATDYITKPVTPERLFPVLQRWLPSRSDLKPD